MKLRGWLLVSSIALVAPAGASGQSLEDYDYENLAFHGVGADLGYAWPSKVEATTLYSLRFDLGFLGPGVRISPSLSYWTSTMRREELDRLADQLNEFGGSLNADDLGPIDWSDLSVSLDGHFVWTTPIQVFTYLGTGLSLHALNGQGAAIEDTFVEDLLDSITAGAAVMGGFEWAAARRLRIYGEARYTVLTDLSYPALRLGAALMLPASPVGQERP